MPPNKPYAFVKYGMMEDSKRAYDSLNGKEIALEDFDQNVVLYFNFVEKGMTVLLMQGGKAGVITQVKL